MSHKYGSGYSNTSEDRHPLTDESKAIFKAQLTDPPEFRIIINCYAWMVHSKHLTKSAFFKKLLAGPFLESESRSVTLHDDDPRNIARLIMWLYYNAYSVKETCSRVGGPTVSEMITSGLEQYKALPKKLQKTSQATRYLPPIPLGQEKTIHMAMFILADKYDVSELRKYCIKKFREICSIHPSFVWELEDFKTSLIQQSCNAKSVDALIEDELFNKAISHMSHPKLKARVETKPDFAWKLVQKLGEDAGHLKRKRGYGY